MSKGRSQETGDRRQEEWGMSKGRSQETGDRRQETGGMGLGASYYSDILSLGFSANSQPFYPNFFSFLEGKPCTFE